MYSCNYDKEKLKIIKNMLIDNSICFYEKTKIIISMIKKKYIKNEIIIRYIKIYFENIDLNMLNYNNDVFYELAKCKRPVVLKNILNIEKINKLINKELCFEYACKSNQTKNIGLLLKENVAIKNNHLELIIDNKNIDAFRIVFDKIKVNKEIISMILNKKWYPAIYLMVEYNEWVNKIDNKIIKEMESEKLFNPILKKIKLKQIQNRIEVF